ncbi:hypothetical protein ACFSYD_15620 [Paracoccus aerius]
MSVFRVDGRRRDVRVATAAPSREADHLLRLFQGRLDGLDPGFGFDLIRLAAEATEPLATAQVGLDGNADTALHLSRLIDRLVSRFGADAVSRPLPFESHLPERSQTRADALRDDPPPRRVPTGPSACSTRPRRCAFFTPFRKARPHCSSGGASGSR